MSADENITKGKSFRKAKPVRGRPTKFSKEIADRIVSYILAGNYVETAAAAAGLEKHALYDWLRRGAKARATGIDKDQKYQDFSHAVDEAVMKAEATDVAVIAKAGRGYPVKKYRTITRPVVLKTEVKHRDGSISKEEHVEHVTEKVEEESHEFDWRASAWRLERRNPKQWGRREFIENDRGIEKPVEEMSDDELDQELNAMLGEDLD